MSRTTPASREALENVLLAVLETRGLASSAELQSATGKSQPTLSRLLRGLSTHGVVAIGRGRGTRYGVCKPILGTVLGQQPIWRHDVQGGVERWGSLTWLAKQQIHVQAGAQEWLLNNEFPWFLAPLRIEGYLGRLAARSSYLSAVVGDDPENWSVEQHLYAAIARVHDGPGAMTLGDPEGGAAPEPSPTDDTQRALHYDRIAADVAAHLNPGSSAGGEQAKFVANRAVSSAGRRQWEHLIVKFTAPRDTPFGGRWHDLLHAEALSLLTLREAGEPAAFARVLTSDRRTYLESVRFDRVGSHGRRHAVSLKAVHAAFVGGSMRSWAATADALVAQRRLSADDARRARLWRAFGRLIGNSDMHFGNLSLWADDPASGRFALAPCYDMLPMAYRPDLHRDDLGPMPLDPAAPTPQDAAVWPQARQLAQTFWQRVADHRPCSTAFRRLAAENAARLGPP